MCQRQLRQVLEGQLPALLLAAHALAVVFVWCHAVEPDVLLKIHIVLLQTHGVSLHVHGEKWVGMEYLEHIRPSISPVRRQHRE